MALSDSIVAYYKLDETSGSSVADATGNGNTGTTDATLNQSGKINTCFLFPANISHLALGSKQWNTSNGYSISLWVKFLSNSVNDACGLVDATWDGLTLFATYNNGSVALLVRNTSINYSLSNPTSWNHIVLTYDSSHNAALYVNGVSVATGSSSVWPSSTLPYTIGSHSDNGSSYYYGANAYIDEVCFFGRNLSSSEVSALYNSGSGLAYPFSTDVTIYPSVLSVSTAEETINARVNLTGEALQSTLSLKTAIISAINPVYKFGQKELRTSWDALTALDPTKAVGHIQNLVPETSLVPSRYNVGI